MTLTIPKHKLPENGTLDDVIIFLKRQNGLWVHIVGAQHRKVVLGGLPKNPDTKLDWTMEKREVFITMQGNGIPVFSVEVIKSGKNLNNASSKVLSFADFLDALHAFIAYSRTFEKCYPVLFREERL